MKGNKNLFPAWLCAADVSGPSHSRRRFTGTGWVWVRMCEDHLVGVMMDGWSDHCSALAPRRPGLCPPLCTTTWVWWWPILQSHTAARAIYIKLPCVVPVCQHANTGGELPTDKGKRPKEVSRRVLLRGVTTNTPVTCRHISRGCFTSHSSWLSPCQPGSPVPCVGNKGWRCPPAGSLPQLLAHLPQQPSPPSPVVCLAIPSLPIASPPWPWNPIHECHPCLLTVGNQIFLPLAPLPAFSFLKKETGREWSFSLCSSDSIFSCSPTDCFALQPYHPIPP